ncbi:hypothetical protein QBC36DRAFT_317555 [Triangularia setosa]|uniref:Uncharacterized protein n=1 Tax=Triangularia setosa TaxID=2587417 RepID=A0AAN6WH41_9PEZI|nr:hypothetical protein QBC36DRAFT_317555 [Podospora setosa]
MIIYPPLSPSPLSPTLTLSLSSPLPSSRPAVLENPKSKPQLHTHLHHQTYNSLLSLPLAFSISIPSPGLLSPSNIRTAPVELNLYFSHNRSCALLRDLDDFFTLKNGCDGISPPVGQSTTSTPNIPGGDDGSLLSPELVAEKIDRLKELLFQWERIIPVHNSKRREGSQVQNNIGEEGWKEWWEERAQVLRGRIAEEEDETAEDDVPFVPDQRTGVVNRDDTDKEDVPFVPDRRDAGAIEDGLSCRRGSIMAEIADSSVWRDEDDDYDDDVSFIPDHRKSTAEDNTDNEHTPFVPDRRRNTMEDTPKQTVRIGIDDPGRQGGEIPLFLDRVNANRDNKDRLRVLRSRNHHRRFKTAELESLLQQLLGQVLQKEMRMRLRGLRNDNTALEHFLRRREGDCGGR